MYPIFRTFKWPLIALLGIILAVVYYLIDPAVNQFFPKCPFYWLTGYKCPGCGSQRAVHYILNGELKNAFMANPLLISAFPYILLGFAFDYTSLKTRYPVMRNFLFGKKAIIITIIIVVAYWILRNTHFFHF